MINLIFSAISIFVLFYFVLNPLYQKKTHRWIYIAILLMSVFFFTVAIEDAPAPLHHHRHLAVTVLPYLALTISFTRWVHASIRQRFDYRWLQYFYYFNLIATVIITTELASDFTLHQLFPLTLSGLIILTLAGITYLIAYLVQKSSERFSFKFKKQTPATRTINRDMMKHYQAHGLSPDEIDHFRQQMAAARDRINRLEVTIPQSARLRSIEQKENIIETCQTFFKDIVDEPERLPEASEFIVTYLPSLEDLVDKYNEISQHVAKNKQTYLILDKAAVTIVELSQEIKSAYINFHQQTYNDLEDEVAFTRKHLQRQQTKESDIYDETKL